MQLNGDPFHRGLGGVASCLGHRAEVWLIERPCTPGYEQESRDLSQLSCSCNADP